MSIAKRVLDLLDGTPLSFPSSRIAAFCGSEISCALACLKRLRRWGRVVCVSSLPGEGTRWQSSKWPYSPSEDNTVPKSNLPTALSRVPLPPVKLYTIGQVAKVCGCSAKTAQKWFDGGKLKGFLLPLSKDRRVYEDVLVAFMLESGLRVPAELLERNPQTATAIVLQVAYPTIAEQ
jgi:hypothetical protein